VLFITFPFIILTYFMNLGYLEGHPRKRTISGTNNGSKIK
jgi:hypothetical protein